MIDLNKYYVAKTYDGVSGSYAGRPGFVPQAATGDSGKFLRADGSWAIIDTSNFYTKNNPSGFITGVNLSSYATVANLATTGSTLNTSINSLSGYINSSSSNIVFTTGDQTISGVKTFNTIIANHFSGGQFSGPAGSNLIVSARGQQIFTADANQIYLSKPLSAQGQNITNVPSLALNWGNGGIFVAGGSNGVIDQRDGLNPQQFRVYNYTGTNSGEFATFGWQATGTGSAPNALVIGAQATQSGILRGVVITGASISVYPQPWTTGTEQYNAFDINITPTNSDYRSTPFRINNTQGNPIFGVQGAAGHTLNQKVRIFGDQRGIVFGPRQTSAGGSADFVSMRWQTSQVQLLHGTEIGWSQSPFDVGADLTIFRDAADTLAQRRGLNPQQFRVYNYTGTNSGEFATFGWRATGTGSAPNALVIGSQATQSGTLRDVILTGMDVYVRTSGITRISRNSTATAFTSLLAVQRGNTNVFTVRDDGATEAVGFSTPLLAGHSSMNADGFAVRSVGSFRISSDVASFSPDVFLRRDGPGIFSQYNGINQQQYRLYNATGTNSGEFATLGWSGNTFLIAPQSTQSGINRNLEIHAAGFGRRIIVTNNGHVGIGTSAGDQTSHGIWVNPSAGQTSITHGAGQVLVSTTSVMFNSNTRVFNNNAFTFGTSQNSTIPMIRGFTGILPNVQVLSSDGTIFGGLDAAQLRVYGTTGISGIASGEFGFLGWSTRSGISPTFVVGPQQTNSGILRDLILTGANINLASSGVIIPNPTVPTSTGSEGTRGQISWDDDFIYVCVSGNSWKRAALTTW